MARYKERGRPRDYIAQGAEWPEGPLKPTAPIEAHLARGIAIKTKRYIEDRFPKSKDIPDYRIAGKVEISPQTLSNLLNGNTWPDLSTIARLERYLRRRLWGREHRDTPRPTGDPDTVNSSPPIEPPTGDT